MYITGKPLGGEARQFGGEVSPLPPPVDRTLVVYQNSKLYINWAHSSTLLST